jgi:hypothetical protein
VGSSSTSQFVIILRDDPFEQLFKNPCSSGLLISSKAFGKPCSGAKTLGWEHSNDSLKMISKTLEWSAIPLMDFKNEFENKVGMYIPELEAGVFHK